jgi:hypothetical protein
LFSVCAFSDKTNWNTFLVRTIAIYAKRCASVWRDDKNKQQMKQITLLLFILISTNIFSQGNQILEKPKVDERIELLSIVFRLADSKEYSSKKFKLYTDKIDNHFEKYKNHELIEFIKKIREENGTSYDAVMKMAIHLGKAPKFKPLVEFTNEVPEERWGKENSLKFIKLLQKFYKDSDCKRFFKENIKLYQTISEKFIPIYNNLDLKWYLNFYGKEPNEKFIIVNGLGNGGGNYGPDIVFKNGMREVYAIMGTWSVDSLGMAKFDVKDYFPTLLHEFNHSFVNNLTEKNLKGFQQSGEKIFSVVEKDMNKQAYGDWKTMISESIVRAAVIKYMKDHKFEKVEIDNEMQEQLNRGFLWMNELVDELEKYDRQRDKYPTLESYIPNIITAYNTYADNIKLLEKQFDEKRPKVLSINEFNNYTQNVNFETKTISITFDKPLLGKGYSINYGEKGKTFYPKFGEIKYSEDKKTVILNVELEKDKEYQFILSGRSFKSNEKIPMREYEINFRTQ